MNNLEIMSVVSGQIFVASENIGISAPGKQGNYIVLLALNHWKPAILFLLLEKE
tara:strand:+ start:235 stop:396 length:162 start_codon:yes stop_codon:yes gene_type:complete